MRIYMTLILALGVQVASATSSESFVDPHSIESDLISEFMLMVSPNQDQAESTEDLFARLARALATRMQTEPQRPTSDPFRPWQETIRQRVEVLAERLARVLAEPASAETASDRTDRALGIMVDLNAALARNTGREASLVAPALIGSGSLVAGGLVAHGLDYNVAAMSFAPLAALAGIGGLKLEYDRTGTGTSKRKLVIARRMVDVFIDGVEWHWRHLAPADLAGLEPGSPELPDAVSKKLGLGTEMFVPSCARWLATLGSIPAPDPEQI